MMEAEAKEAGLTPISGALGTNPGGFYRDAEGRELYVKWPPTEAHQRNEMLAATLYGLARVNTLQYVTVPGAVATIKEQLTRNRAEQLSIVQIVEAQRDFAVHAWLANYDAVGTGGDNVGVSRGNPIWLDLGGSLIYRARGAMKENFGFAATEFDTMRDPTVNRDAAEFFGCMTAYQLRESASKVLMVPDALIRGAVQRWFGHNDQAAKLAIKLTKRKYDIGKRAFGR